MRLHELLRPSVSLPPSINSNKVAAESGSFIQRDQPIFTYGGRYHRVPEDFTFQRTFIENAWQLWWFGNSSQNLPAFRALDFHDMPTNNLRKRLSDFRYRTLEIEKIVI